MIRLAIGIMVLLGAVGGVHAAGEGYVAGCVSVRDAQGQAVFGNWVRVYLVREAIAPSSIPEPDPGNRMARREWINDIHMDFFIRFQEKMEKPGFLVDAKLTREDGTFAFNPVPPGTYHVIVTFPTLIAGQKCAWQVPAEVAAGERCMVELKADNQALPGK